MAMLTNNTRHPNPIITPSTGRYLLRLPEDPTPMVGSPRTEAVRRRCRQEHIPTRVMGSRVVTQEGIQATGSMQQI
jgi:hypothetical protein